MLGIVWTHRNQHPLDHRFAYGDGRAELAQKGMLELDVALARGGAEVAQNPGDTLSAAGARAGPCAAYRRRRRMASPLPPCRGRAQDPCQRG
jgi:hypothetical protein